ncbi:MAG: hypothetical protein M3Q29_16215 [Chloroflexota bacterium]|nr:hypothetical protein [Chloroflexota bacterium]
MSNDLSMALDLIRAALVAILVGVVPGYFWARTFFQSQDWPERIAMSLGLSFTLVPVTALLLARLFGPGITLPIAAASVVLVTLTGIALCFRLETRSGPGTPPGMEHPPLGIAALIPLVIALALMLGRATGRLPDNRAAITLLIIATAILAQLPNRRWWNRRAAARRNADEGSTPADIPQGIGPAPDQGYSRHTTLSRMLRFVASPRFLLPVVLLLVLLRGYVGPALHDWPYIRGQDQYAHTVMVNLMMSRGTVTAYMVYPPGFHTLTAVMARLSGLQPLQLFALLAPALLLLPALACYSFARRFFGPEYGVASALFAGLVLTSPWFFMRDGTYVDLIAAEFLLVLTIVSLLTLLASPSVQGILLTAILGSSVVLYHQVSSIYLALLFGMVSILFLPYLLIRNRHRGIALFLSLALATVISVAYAWDTYNLPGTLRALFGGTESTETLGHASMAIGTQRPRNLEVLPGLLSQPVVWFGLLGFLLLAFGLRRMSSAHSMAAVFLLGWCLIFFAGSRTSLSGFPIRFTRDLGIPLAILAAFAFVTALKSSRRYRPVGVITAALAALFVALGVQQSLLRASGPSTQLFMTPTYAAAGRWLRFQNQGGNIMTNPHLNQVPGNAMLAIGGYSALQSFTKSQLGNPRVVPPAHRQEVEDTLWVLRHPAGEKTRRILDEHDIRYIVMYKRLPERTLWTNKHPVRWKPFLRQPDLYKPAFENSDVIIFRVK